VQAIDERCEQRHHEVADEYRKRHFPKAKRRSLYGNFNHGLFIGVRKQAVHFVPSKAAMLRRSNAVRRRTGVILCGSPGWISTSAILVWEALWTEYKADSMEVKRRYMVFWPLSLMVSRFKHAEHGIAITN
jgi:hypothetical protein